METKKRISYWQEFSRTHPDATRLKSIVSKDPFLTNIFNFCSYPSIFSDSLKRYPFDDKIIELGTITAEDISYLTKLGLEATDDQEFYDYLLNIFDLVANTVRFKNVLDSENQSEGRKYSEEQVLEIVEGCFKKFLSVDETLTLENGETVRRIGKYFPRLGIEIHNVSQPGSELSHTRIKIYHSEFFRISDEEGVAAKFDWDRFSGESFAKYHLNPLLRDICFYSPSNYTIQHYFKGKPILKKPFEFQIGKRYEPLIFSELAEMGKEDRVLRKSGQSLEQKYGEDVKSLGPLWESFYAVAKTFDSAKGHLASHLKEGLEYHKLNFLKHLSSLISGKRILDARIEKPASEFLKETQENGDEDESKAIGRLFDEHADYASWHSVAKSPEDVTEHKKRSDLLKQWRREDPLLDDILKKEEEGIALTPNERQYKVRLIKKKQLEHKVES